MSNNTEKFVEDITRRIVDIINIILSAKEPFDPTEPFTMFSSAEYDISFSLTGNGFEDFNELVDYLARARRWKSRLSSKYVEKSLEDVFHKSLSRVRDDSANVLPRSLNTDYISKVRNSVEELFAKYDSDSACEWCVYVPLAGVDLSVIERSSLEIGRVCLQQMNDVRIQSLNDKVSSILLSSIPPITGVARDAYGNEIRNKLEKLRNGVCAVSQVKAEPRRAKEIAEEQTQDVLDLLAYFIATEYPKSYQISVGLFGELTRAVRETFCLPLTEGGFSVMGDLVRGYTPLQLTPAIIEKMGDRGIFHVANMLKKGRRNDLEETIIDGIRWFATSQRQFKETLEFVTLITCLENCLTPEKDDPKTTAIAEGCALLLGKTLESRKKLKKDVKYLYGRRSGTLHSGITERGWESANFDPAICPDFGSCLAKLRAITMGIIAVLIKYHTEFGLKSKQDLLARLEEEKLTPKKA